MKKNIGVMLLLGAFFFMLSSANATTFSFLSDDTIHWATWLSTKSWQNTEDIIGSPNIEKVFVITDDASQKLLKIRIDFSGSKADPKYAGGSGLFIDFDGDGKWDFFADNFRSPSPNWGLYKLKEGVSLEKGPLTDGKYRISNLEWGNSGRFDHPVGIVASLLGSRIDLGYDWDENMDTLTYTFSGAAGIILSNTGKWIIGYAELCANDVFLTSTPDIPVPESATLLLLGTGLIGLAGLGKARFFRK